MLRLMKKWMLSKANQVLALCLSALGLAGCTSPLMCEYGCPYATFTAEGEVKNEAAEPIEGVKIVVREYDAMPIEESYISTKTKADGTYRTADGTTIFPADSVWIHAIDNTGTYADDSAKVKVNYVTKGDGHWYEGEAEAKADFVLKKKEQ